ncbi:MAG: hypothetical protein JST26_20035 [Bacteroidetes bacterium]|nr:hypothetical protein [Bacteroidota bacterium]
MQFETRTSYISVIEDCIIYIKVRPDMHVEVKDAEENDEMIKRLNPDGKKVVLLHTQGIFTTGPDVLKRGASEEASGLYKALAILIDKHSPGLIGKYFIKVNKPKQPTQLFTKMEEALAWCREQYALANP